ncbi:NAD(+) diphosphatase [Biformimicrobium ophioploci]|uniref:NAD(+) diphosphatase n=1 Tax=Biformimicrobium ophioploci TaxID=3036711 RepID=A0ABQ6M2V7_9GAMM|nr:NAD(+) diphosphatase [Microbulbifer sp. NKW57]GMG88694.1 hypothetical protein MNKW57_30150 [Microbulbifer sp. NKW57]
MPQSEKNSLAGFEPLVAGTAEVVVEYHIYLFEKRVLAMGQERKLLLERALGDEWQGQDRESSPASARLEQSQMLGYLDGKAVCVHVLATDLLPEGGEWVGLREALSIADELLFTLLSRAAQVVEWQRNHQFCGRCGGQTSDHGGELATICRACGLSFYPRISPCVIAIITDGDHLLLARNSNFRGAYYSALAGFIEAGESAEQALVREVREEVGVEVGNISYFGSQPWPFPGQLMLGYFAEYAGGDLRPDGTEIIDAQWYHYEQLPQIPPPFTISGQLIRHFVESRRRAAAEQK